MTTKKVDDLTTDELNEQVALCQGWKPVAHTLTSYIVWGYEVEQGEVELWSRYHPCTKAQQAFEIIEREKISLNYGYNLCVATKINEIHSLSTASTALIAAMRCFVKSVKGDEVEL